MGKLILNHLIWSNCLEFLNGFLYSYSFKLNLRSDCFDFCFWTVTLKTILNLNHYKSATLFKHDSSHMSSLNLTQKLSFKPRHLSYRIFIINFYYAKRKRFYSLGSLLFIYKWGGGACISSESLIYSGNVCIIFQWKDSFKSSCIYWFYFFELVWLVCKKNTLVSTDSE